MYIKIQIKKLCLTSRFETDNISSVELLLRHNSNKYLPAFLYLPGTTLFVASVSKGATSTIFNAFGMARPGCEPTTFRSRSGRSNN